MLKSFRTYQLAVNLYREAKSLGVPGYLKDQLLRSASSIALNLAEGSAKPSRKERLRYYHIAFASLRETQCILELEGERYPEFKAKADILAAHLYKLCSQ